MIYKIVPNDEHCSVVRFILLQNVLHIFGSCNLRFPITFVFLLKSWILGFTTKFQFFYYAWEPFDWAKVISVVTLLYPTYGYFDVLRLLPHSRMTHVYYAHVRNSILIEMNSEKNNKRVIRVVF
jgi:hypothetical protein